MISENFKSNLWSVANKLRGKMDANEYKNYILGFLFFIYISNKIEKYIEKEFKGEEIDQEIIDDIIDQLGFYLSPQNYYSKILNDIKNNQNLDSLNINLNNAFNEIENTTSQESKNEFEGLFKEMKLEDSKLGESQIEINQQIAKIISSLEDVHLNFEDNDFLGDAYEYLISQFAGDAGKKGGEFYTPSKVSQLIAKIVSSTKISEKANYIYDPTCGSGSLLMKTYNEIKTKLNGKKVNSKILGQELNNTTYNLARMNMILQGLAYDEFELLNGDTIRNDKFKDKDKFDIIVANPPFGTKWEPTEKEYEQDERFINFDALAPASRAEYVFVQHMISHLSEDGIMVTVLPHGVLFRGGTEEKIRKQLIKENKIDAIIGLPSNLFFGTGIPAIIMVVRKCKKDNDILFIDSSKDFEKVKTQNVLRDIDIEKIVSTFSKREEIDKYSKRASLEEIEENDFNLNVSRYVDSSEEIVYRPIEEIEKDLEKAIEEEKIIEKELKVLEKKLYDEILNWDNEK